MVPWRRAVPGAVALVCLFAHKVLPVLPAEFDERGLLYPAQRMAIAMGREPDIAPDLRILVMDDLSMLGATQPPTFAELTAVSQQLLAKGFEAVLISGVTLEANAKGVSFEGTPAGKVLGVGAVAYPPDRRSGMAHPIDTFAPEFFVADASLQDDATRPVAGALLGPRFDSGKGIVRYGALNTDSDAQAPAAWQVAPGLLMPNLSLLVSKDFLADPSRFLAKMRDEKIYVDFLSVATVTSAAVRLGPILKGEPLSDKLTGGRVALIVPDGHTGSRFVRSPQGTVPSYVALASLVSSNMLGRPIIKPQPGFFKGACIILLLLVLAFGPPRLRLALGAALVFLTYAFAAIATVKAKRFVPGASTASIMMITWFAAALQNSLQSFASRVKLSVELDMGSAVQRLFLPGATTWKFGRWSIAIQHKAFGALSGDWYQVYVPSQGSHFAVVAIGDVVGKGTSAALITAGIATLWHDVTVEWEKGRVDIDQFLRRLNHVIEASFKNQQYTTLCLAVLLPDEAILVCCAAPQWLIVRDDWSSENVRSKASQPLGMHRDGSIPDVTKHLTVTPGTTLVAYTDGLLDGSRARTYFRGKLEQKGQAGEPFTLEAFASVAWAPTPADVAPIPDDATLMMLRYE